ncbi:LOW QUALITY PROTEIN: hypothetical protein PanWU01x14_343380 [Parasponia andersonii]|uniref:Uncharacterized protein n=1 Tax=Parasponia andersonii TaxID=3476 RepID=A0A2P5ADE8_PARAD|nr:LOW QUALITY PROTEIN: hypothetical protein PanWU01x14_343380 [Parasponia andersonii]
MIIIFLGFLTKSVLVVMHPNLEHVTLDPSLVTELLDQFIILLLNPPSQPLRQPQHPLLLLLAKLGPKPLLIRRTRIRTHFRLLRLHPHRSGLRRPPGPRGCGSPLRRRTSRAEPEAYGAAPRGGTRWANGSKERIADEGSGARGGHRRAALLPLVLRWARRTRSLSGESSGGSYTRRILARRVCLRLQPLGTRRSRLRRGHPYPRHGFLGTLCTSASSAGPPTPRLVLHPNSAF